LILEAEAMTQTALEFTRPRPDDLFTPGSQSFRIYERLLQRPVSNSEIVREMDVFNSTGRISDIRKALKPHLMDVEAKRVRDGLFVYELKG
jgi:hypothetical protein